jgi:hypothetical protein
MNRNHGNTLVYTLLGLAVAAIVGLCFAPLTLRPCGHRYSLVDRWVPGWAPHYCAGDVLLGDLWQVHCDFRNYQKKYGHLPDSFSSVIPNFKNLRFEYTYTKEAGDWQLSVPKTGDRMFGAVKTPDLPGWYLLTSDGKVHFSEEGPATVQDVVLPSDPLLPPP